MRQKFLEKMVYIASIARGNIFNSSPKSWTDDDGNNGEKHAHEQFSSPLGQGPTVVHWFSVVLHSHDWKSEVGFQI